MKYTHKWLKYYNLTYNDCLVIALYTCETKRVSGGINKTNNTKFWWMALIKDSWLGYALQTFFLFENSNIYK